MASAEAVTLLSVAVSLPVRAQGGATGARMELAGISEAARTAFINGIGDLANVFPARGLSRLEEALKLEPGFGLARVFWARQAPNLTMEARTAELNRGVADATKGSAGEAALAIAMRAQRLGQRDEARRMFIAARQLLPGDPWVAHFTNLGSLAPDATLADQLVAQQRLVTQFPDLAPVYNNLAYNRYRAGDRAGGLEAARKYVELAPTHPNSKGSDAELLQWEGRFDEAVALYREAAALDPSYGAAYTGIADARQLQGRGADARAALAEALPLAATPQARANLQRLVALSFAADGDRTGAEQALGSAMEEAKTVSGPALVANIHRDFAQVSLMTGNPGGVASHLEAAGQGTVFLGASDALLLAAAGLNAEATAKLEETLRRSDAASNTFVQGRASVIRALVLVNQGQAEAALAEIAKGDVTVPIAKAVMALAEQQRKNPIPARLFRDQVRSDPQSTIGDRELGIARTLAGRVK